MSGSLMRLAYVDPQPYPSPTPESLQTYHTCVGLAAHAAGVWLIGGSGGAGEIGGYYGVPQPPNLVVLRLPRFRKERGWFRPAWTWPFQVLALLSLRRLAHRVKIAAVLTRDLKLARYLLRAHRHRALPPVAFESHQIFADTLREEAAQAGRDVRGKLARLTGRESEVYREAAGLIVLTHRQASILNERFATRGRILVAPDGVDLRGPLPVAPGAAEGPVTYLGNFHPWKGVEILVRAVALAPGVSCCLVGGESEPRARIAALAAALGVSDRVHLVGQVPPPERWQYLADASVCVLPLTRSAFGTSFTSPLKLFEYMAAGRPIVASDLPALREVLRDGDNALLVAPEDPAALAAALQRLRGDRPLAARLADRAARDAHGYTWDARGKRLAEFLAGLRAA